MFRPLAKPQIRLPCRSKWTISAVGMPVASSSPPRPSSVSSRTACGIRLIPPPRGRSVAAPAVQVSPHAGRPRLGGRVYRNPFDPGGGQRERRREAADTRPRDDHLHPSMIPYGGKPHPQEGCWLCSPGGGLIHSVSIRRIAYSAALLKRRACPPVRGGRARSDGNG